MIGVTAAAGSPFVLASVAILVVPVVASLSVVAKGFGPFDTPFEPVAASSAARQLAATAEQVVPLLPALERRLPGQTDLMATQTSAVAAPFIYDTGQEVLPIGGYSGSIPEPSLTSPPGRDRPGPGPRRCPGPEGRRPAPRLGRQPLPDREQRANSSYGQRVAFRGLSSAGASDRTSVIAWPRLPDAKRSSVPVNRFNKPPATTPPADPW